MFEILRRFTPQNDNNVIPNRDLWSSVRNLHRPIRNGGDCTLAWREIFQSKAFQNDMRLGKVFFTSLRSIHNDKNIGNSIKII